MTILDRTAVRIAQEIAAHHSHQWCDIVLPEGDLTVDSIADATYAQTTPGVCGWGRVAPIVSDDGSVGDSTATGRLTWSVYPHYLHLSLSRPDGEYVAVMISWHGDRDIQVTCHVPDGAPTIFARHVEYAVESALMGVQAVAAVLPRLAVESEESIVETVRSVLDPYRVDEIGYWLDRAAEADGRVYDLLAALEDRR